MAQNFVTKGDVLEYLIPADTTIIAGAVVIVGSLVGIALEGGTTGKTIEIMLNGVFEVNKGTSQAWTQGAPIYITSGGTITTSASGNTLIGHAFEAAAQANAVGRLKLLR